MDQEDHSPPYSELALALGIREQDMDAFSLLLGVCDRQFHPSYSHKYVLSLETLSDIFIALLYMQTQHTHSIQISKYTMSVQVFKLLLYIVEFLGPTRDEEFEVLGLCCGPDFVLKLQCWTPKSPLNESNDNLKLCYLLCSMAVYVLYKLGPENLALNPYTPKLVELWKVYTIIILNCLHIDRELEEKEQDSPEIVLEVLKGASLFRYILGYCLNSEHDKYYKVDIEFQPYLDLYNPVERHKSDGGALTVDIHYFDLVRFMLNTGTVNDGYDDLRDNAILINDNYDQDIQYVFDYDDEDPEYLSDVANSVLEAENGDLGLLDVDNIDTYRAQIFKNSYKVAPPTREYEHGKNQFVSSWTREFEYDKELTKLGPEDLLKSLITAKDTETQQKLLTTIQIVIASGVIEEILELPWVELLFVLDPPSFFEEDMSRNNIITPVVRVTWFEILLMYHPHKAQMVFSEMFMKHGHRLQLIWSLCHDINLSMQLIDFVFQLLVDGTFPLKFSREGTYLELSKYEKDQIIYEFIEGASEFLSVGDGVDFDDGLELILSPSIVSKYVSFLCLFLESLLQKDIIGTHSPHVLQVVNTFLVRFMTKATVARKLCFKIKQLIQEARIVEPTPSKEVISQKLLVNGNDYESFYTNTKRTVEHLRRFLNQTQETSQLDVLSGIRTFLNMFPEVMKDEDLIQRLIDDLPEYSLDADEKKAKKKKKKKKK